MLDGWYCRSMANMQAEGEAATRGGGGPRGGAHVDEDYSSDSSQSEPEPINYRAQYNTLKKKLKYLIYENECFQESLRSSQKRLLKSCRDRTFLLDRLLQYEKPDNSSSESDETDSSDDAESSRMEQTKKRRVEPAAVPGHGGNQTPNSSANVKSQNVIKRKRPPPPKKVIQNSAPLHQVTSAKALSLTSDGHMTPEEVERHLQSRQSFLELVPEKAPPTVPTEMFSNDPSLDSESNDLLETSPCNLGDDWVE